MKQLLADSAPIECVKLFHGAADTIVPLKTIRWFAQTHGAGGTKIELTELQNGTHHGVIFMLHDEIIEALNEL